MSVKYKFQDQAKLYFVTFAVVSWVDVFSRRIYKDLSGKYKILSGEKGAGGLWLVLND